jgi:hypothetical protein
MFVCCVLSGRVLCDELITRLEESYRQWRVVVFDPKTLSYKDAIDRAGLQSQTIKNRFIFENNIKVIYGKTDQWKCTGFF